MLTPLHATLHYVMMSDFAKKNTERCDVDCTVRDIDVFFNQETKFYSTEKGECSFFDLIFLKL